MADDDKNQRSTWSRALEMIKNSRIRGNMRKNENSEDFPQTEENLIMEKQRKEFNYMVVELSYPPRQKILQRLTELVTRMQYGEDGLKTFNYNFNMDHPDHGYDGHLDDDEQVENHIEDVAEEEEEPNEEEEAEEEEEEEADEDQEEVEEDQEEDSEEQEEADEDQEEEGEEIEDEELEDNEDEEEEPEEVEEEELEEEEIEEIDEQPEEEEEEEDEEEVADEEEHIAENGVDAEETDADDGDTWSFEDEGGMIVPVEGVFTSTELIKWLKENLEIELDREASHMAAMLCKLGFILPCRSAWDIKSITAEKKDRKIWMFQSRQYWPSEGHIANEADHARHLLRRKENNFGIPFDDYESEYLSTLEVVLSHKWEILKATTEFKKRTDDDEAIVQPEHYIAAWQEYAYWKVNRPASCVHCLGSTNPYEFAACLRGLNRNLPSYAAADIPGPERSPEVDEDLDDAINNDLKNSCKRIIAYSEKMAVVDPFIIEGYSHNNPWTNEIVKLNDEVPNKIRCDGWELSFDFLLKDKIGRDLFGQHLQQEFSFENLDFYNQCVQLRCGPQRQVEEKTEEIFEEFISRESNTPVNIDEDIVSHISNEIKCERLRYAFDRALNEIYRLMKKDSYIRFLSSSLYKDVVEQSTAET